MSMMVLLLIQNIVCSIYTAYRLYLSFLTNYKKTVSIPVIMLLCNSFIITRSIEKFSHSNIPDFLIFISDIILALFIYIFLFYLFTDFIKVIFKLLKMPFISHYLQGFISVIMAVIICLLGFLNSHLTKINEYNITLNKTVYTPFTFAALADIHIGSDMTPARLGREIQRINSLKPDFVLIAGDIIDNNIRDFTEEYIKEFKKLEAPFGVYAVFGNHEYYSGNQKDILSVFNKAGFKTLIDDVVYIPEKEIYIIGRDSLRHTNSSNNERTDIETLYSRINDKTKPVIILDHIPKGLDDGKKINADIQISGHTHDGQFFPVNLIVKKMYVLSHGMIKYDGFHYFVTSGLGLWGPPVRVGTDSEIMLINVNNIKSAILH